MDQLPLGYIVSSNSDAIKLVREAVEKECSLGVCWDAEEMLAVFPTICAKIKFIFFDLDPLGSAVIDPLDQLQALRAISHIPEIIGFTKIPHNVERCRNAMRLGAFELMLFPFSKDRINVAMHKALNYSDSVKRLNSSVRGVVEENEDKRIEILHEILHERRLNGRFLSPDELRALIPMNTMDSIFTETFKDNYRQTTQQLESPNIVVMIVEDEESIRDSIRLLLRANRFKPICAGNAKEALALAQKHPEIELICLDIGLPDQSGIELLPLLKAILPDAEVVMITGYKTVDLVIQSFHNLAADYIVKPYEEEELMQVISRAIQHRYLSKVLNSGSESTLLDHALTVNTRIKIFQDLAEKRLLNDRKIVMDDLYVFFPNLRSSGVPGTISISKRQVDDGVLLLVEELSRLYTAPG